MVWYGMERGVWMLMYDESDMDGRLWEERGMDGEL